PRCGQIVPVVGPAPATASPPAVPSPSAKPRATPRAGGLDHTAGYQGGCTEQDLTALLAPPLAPDEVCGLGPYRVLKVLGSGGMGAVFLGEDPALERQVALKVLLAGQAGEVGRKRFLREARAAAAIEHDHIVPIFQVGEADVAGAGTIPY